MKLLLTGHRGYIGSHIHRFLLMNYRDAEVVVLDDDRQSMDAYRKSIPSADFSHVIHAGAFSSTTEDCADCFEWNYRATQVLSEAINPEAHFIFLSSCAGNDPVTTAYGFSKRAAADFLRNNRDKYTIFIPYNVYGNEVGRTKKFSNPEYIVRRQIWGISKPFVRDYIHIDDCLRMIAAAIDKEVIGTYEMGAGVGYDFDQLCEFGKIDLSDVPVYEPGHEKYPIVGPADRVAKSPFLEPTVCVKEWIERQNGC